MQKLKQTSQIEFIPYTLLIPDKVFLTVRNKHTPVLPGTPDVAAAAFPKVYW